jgi:hypothetical protein
MVQIPWEIIITLALGLVWLVRLEAKVLYLEKDRKLDLERQESLWNKLDSMQVTLTTILTSLAKLEGKMEVRDE